MENKGVKKETVLFRIGSNGVETSILDLLSSGRFLDCGELFITKTTMGKRRQGERFLIYLPGNRAYLWKELNERRAKVRVYLELQENKP
jgi:hypothetical protein